MAVFLVHINQTRETTEALPTNCTTLRTSDLKGVRGLGGVVVIDAAIGTHGRGSRLAHYLTVAATLDKSLTSHCL